MFQWEHGFALQLVYLVGYISWKWHFCAASGQCSISVLDICIPVTAFKNLANRKNPRILESDQRKEVRTGCLQNFTWLYICNTNIKELRCGGVWFSLENFLFNWLVDLDVGRGYSELTWKRSVNRDHQKKFNIWKCFQTYQSINYPTSWFFFCWISI